MKKEYLLIASFVLLFFSCSDDIHNIDTTQINKIGQKEPDEFPRLNFTDSNDLLEAINNQDSKKTKSGSNFISLMSKMPSNSRLKLEQPNQMLQYPDETSILDDTYYVALKYDELLPNPDFAALFNPEGELEIGNEIIKVTPNGTYKFPVEKEALLKEILCQDPEIKGELLSEDIYEVADGILLYDTYKDDTENLEVIDEGDITEYPDSYFGDDEDESSVLIVKSSSGPNYDSFPVYSNTRKTFAGKLIQNIFQTSVTPTIKFSSKRRLRGQFYHYNWWVYTETGVSGWTDKKNWIGWSKTASDELRVGWRGVVLETKIPDYYAQSLKGMNDIRQNPVTYMKLPGYNTGSMKTITVYNPNASGSDIIKYAKMGAKPLFNFLKKYLTQPTELEKAQALMITTRTHIYTIILNEERIKYNTKSYTHVFANQAKFAVSLDLCNIPGFSSWKDAGKWANVVKETTKMAYPTLKGGEVYCAGRFGNVWKGLKIVKKD